MQGNRRCTPRQVVLPQQNQSGINNVHNVSAVSAFTGGGSGLGPKLSRSTHGVEFQPSEICPRNFIIFDHTEDRSQIMFHPAIVPNIGYSPTDFNKIPIRQNSERKFGKNVDMGTPSTFSEDSDDIDALLCSDDYDEGSGETEEISTARTQGYDGSSSPESCSSYAPKARKVGSCSSTRNTSFDSSGYCEGKRKKVQKMVKVLRGMVPGGDQMNNVAVLDEAVKYLKSMKVEVQKLGIGNLNDFP